MALTTDWEMLRAALKAHVRTGHSLSSIAKAADVSRATLLNWLTWDEPPETITLGQRVIDAINKMEDGK